MARLRGRRHGLGEPGLRPRGQETPGTQGCPSRRQEGRWPWPQAGPGPTLPSPTGKRKRQRSGTSRPVQRQKRCRGSRSPSCSRPRDACPLQDRCRVRAVILDECPPTIARTGAGTSRPRSMAMASTSSRVPFRGSIPPTVRNRVRPVAPTRARNAAGSSPRGRRERCRFTPLVTTSAWTPNSSCRRRLPILADHEHAVGVEDGAALAFHQGLGREVVNVVNGPHDQHRGASARSATAALAAMQSCACSTPNPREPHPPEPVLQRADRTPHPVLKGSVRPRRGEDGVRYCRRPEEPGGRVAQGEHVDRAADGGTMPPRAPGSGSTPPRGFVV